LGYQKRKLRFVRYCLVAMKTKRLASSTWMRAFLVEAWAAPGPLSMRGEMSS
jgi:hypothetical protein